MNVLEILIISSSNAPLANLLVFGLKSTTLWQALAKADAACLTESQDLRSTRCSERQSNIAIDMRQLSQVFGIVIAGYRFVFNNKVGKKHYVTS